jgi:RHS repeat-associated protein
VIGGGTYGFAYNGRNRLSLAQLNGSTVGTYTYNALGQRIGKVTTTAERYGYNENGQLLAEYGATNRDYLWMDDVPVAVVDNTINGSVTTSTINYITADQLNTPRAVTNSAGAVIWQWAYQGNSFGEQQPTSTTGYVLNLRFPGQYYDLDTGTDYNVNRNYEPATGRYLQPDPLGQAAGPSLYAYVHSDPGSRVDPDGRLDTSGPLGQALTRAGAVDAAGGGPEDLIGDALAVGAGAYSLADAIAREANQREVHNVCDEPPPPNLSDCDLAKWKLTKALQCKQVRQTMADKWFGGTFDAGHAQRMAELDNEIARLRRAVDRTCKPCG